ncbi:hypothetical protein [Caldivirga sp.]|uniref:hypothetical protein n=1 Tax=Caldivirga sp. TaxID=2080243 RepID=UPI0025C43311|nr:hypothetical protein [Caldivirga sp.]
MQLEQLTGVRVRMRDFLEALKVIPPSLTDEDVAGLRRWLRTRGGALGALVDSYGNEPRLLNLTL